MVPCTSGPSNSRAPNNTADLPSCSDPLPSQVALEDDALRTAVQMSIADSQQDQKRRTRLMEGYEHELVRAVSESELLGQRLNSAADEQLEETLLRIACEESLVIEQHQRERIMSSSDEQYKNALLLALEQSTIESIQPTKSEEDDQHMLQALAESKASLNEYQAASNSEEDLLKKAIAESLAEEERRNLFQQQLDAVLMEEVMSQSLKVQRRQQQEGEDDATKTNNLSYA